MSLWELESLRVALCHWRVKLRARGHDVPENHHAPVLVGYLTRGEIRSGLPIASGPEPVRPIDAWPSDPCSLESLSVHR